MDTLIGSSSAIFIFVSLRSSSQFFKMFSSRENSVTKVSVDPLFAELCHQGKQNLIIKSYSICKNVK